MRSQTQAGMISNSPAHLPGFWNLLLLRYRGLIRVAATFINLGRRVRHARKQMNCCPDSPCWTTETVKRRRNRHSSWSAVWGFLFCCPTEPPPLTPLMSEVVTNPRQLPLLDSIWQNSKTETARCSRASRSVKALSLLLCVGLRKWSTQHYTL